MEKIEEIAAEQIPYNEHKRAWFADGMKYVIEHTSQFNLVSQEDYDRVVKGLKDAGAASLGLYQKKVEDYDKLKQQADEMAKVLRDLAEFQNGAPLVRYEKEYNKTMEDVWQTLTNYENQVR